MTLKQATIVATIGAGIQVVLGIVYVMPAGELQELLYRHHRLLSLAHWLSSVALLVFFVTLLGKQK